MKKILLYIILLILSINMVSSINYWYLEDFDTLFFPVTIKEGENYTYYVYFNNTEYKRDNIFIDSNDFNSLGNWETLNNYTINNSNIILNSRNLTEDFIINSEKEINKDVEYYIKHKIIYYISGVYTFSFNSLNLGGFGNSINYDIETVNNRIWYRQGIATSIRFNEDTTIPKNNTYLLMHTIAKAHNTTSIYKYENNTPIAQTNYYAFSQYWGYEDTIANGTGKFYISRYTGTNYPQNKIYIDYFIGRNITADEKINYTKSCGINNCTIIVYNNNNYTISNYAVKIEGFNETGYYEIIPYIKQYIPLSENVNINEFMYLILIVVVFAVTIIIIDKSEIIYIQIITIIMGIYISLIFQEKYNYFGNVAIWFFILLGILISIYLIFRNKK